MLKCTRAKLESRDKASRRRKVFYLCQFGVEGWSFHASDDAYRKLLLKARSKAS